MPDSLSLSVANFLRDDVLSEVQRRLDVGYDPQDILSACRDGMTIVGERFGTGEFFISELILSAKIFKDAMAIIEPRLSAGSGQTRARVLLATPRGDIHDLGKDIFGAMLKGQGFEVCDLGVDVDPGVIVAKVEELRPAFVGFSALITSAFPSMKRAAELLEEQGLRKDIKLMVGGGVTNETVKEYVGADFQTVDASRAIQYCLSVTGGS